MKEKCLNCSYEQEITENNTSNDELGKHTVCERCKSSFDVSE